MILPSKGYVRHPPGAKICVSNFVAPACALFIMLFAASCGSSAESGLSAAREETSTHEIEIRNFKFVPDIIIARKDDRIRWKNFDVVPHTATASDNRWDSDLIANEAEWSMTVDKAGVTDYICTYHPAMRAKLVVED